MFKYLSLFFTTFALTISPSISKKVYYKLFHVDDKTDISYYYFCSKEVRNGVNSEWLSVDEEIANKQNCPDKYPAIDYNKCLRSHYCAKDKTWDCLKLCMDVKHSQESKIHIMKRIKHYDKINFNTYDKNNNNNKFADFGQSFSVKMPSSPYLGFSQPVYTLKIVLPAIISDNNITQTCDIL